MLFITNEGHVYSCGWNNYGQLGLNSTDDETTPQLIKKYYDSNSNSINYDAITIKKIACGDSDHSLFLTNEGRVYSCGLNASGQLGLNSWDVITKTRPQLIETFYDADAITITQIACGYAHSLFLTNEGHVYSCGMNYFGQLGLNSTDDTKRTPQLIETFYDSDSDSDSINYDAITINKIACGGEQTFINTIHLDNTFTILP